jgi:hypothetical protein
MTWSPARGDHLIVSRERTTLSSASTFTSLVYVEWRPSSAGNSFSADARFRRDYTMSTCAYIGATDDPEFSWDPKVAKSPYYNLPRRLGPQFPPSDHMGRYGAFSMIIDRIHSGRYHGRKVDWGGYAARVSLDELKRFVDEIFPAGFTFDPPSSRIKVFAHLDQRLQELRDFVGSLAEGEYYLVAAET